METALTNLLGNAGISAVGFLIAFFVLKEKFKQDKETTVAISQEIEKLCQSIKTLIDSFNESRVLQAAAQEVDRGLKEEMMTNYIKIGNKIDAQNANIADIHTLCIRLYEQAGSKPVGEIALAKGFMTKEQLDECLGISSRS